MQNTKFMNFLNRMERKYGKFAVPNLMTIIVFGMGLVFLLDSFTGSNPDYSYGLTSLLYFDRTALFHGQIWRILTFLFLPPNSSPFFVVFALYLYWLIGNALEQRWGSFKFNIYYLCGAVGTILSGLITGYATNTFLNLSLYLAFAVLFPDFEILILYFIPVKMKYLAILEGIGLVISLILGSWTTRLCIVISLANVILFFWKDLYDLIRYQIRRNQWKRRK